MTCPDDRLEEYLDGELRGPDRRSVEEHLGSCEVCRRELEALKRLEQVLMEVPGGTVPDAEAFLARLRRRSRRVRRTFWAVAAAAALVVAAGGYLGSRALRPAGDLRGVLVRYAEAPAPEDEEAIRRAGPAGLRLLEEALEDPEPSVRFAAASLLFRLAGPEVRARVVARFQGPVDVRAELERYAENPSAEAETRIRAAGPLGLAVLEQALEEGTPRVRFAAATLLFRNADRATRDWVLARFQQRREPNGAWTLPEPGVEEEDVEIVPAALSELEGGGERWAMGVLRKMTRLDRAARSRIVDSVVMLLKHPRPEVQKRALQVVKELELDFPLRALVDLIDSPALGEEALEVLRRATGRDFGGDKEAWRKAVAVKEKGL